MALAARVRVSPVARTRLARSQRHDVNTCGMYTHGKRSGGVYCISHRSALRHICNDCVSSLTIHVHIAWPPRCCTSPRTCAPALAHSDTDACARSPANRAYNTHTRAHSRSRAPHGHGDRTPHLGWHYLSNATCLIRPHLFCVFRRVKDHHTLPEYSPLLKNTCVRQVVLDKTSGSP